MNQIRNQVKKTVESIRDWVVHDLIKRQKPELDRKIDSMLKPPKQKVPKIRLKQLGVGKRFGRKTGHRGLGLKLPKKLF